jgi:hypothetical protein
VNPPAKFFCLAKYFTSEELRQEMMRKEQRDIKPGNEVEEKESRDEGVLGGDEIKNEHAYAGECLAQGEAMLAEKFAL